MKMKPIASFGRDDLATVHVAAVGSGESDLIEFVESVQPPIPRSEKWVLIVSTLLGCPVGCVICDAGGRYSRPLSADEIMDQILHLVDQRFPGRRVPVPKFKIQFARMGEPALNPEVLEVLRRLPAALDAPGLLPSVSSVAPHGTEGFFEALRSIKDTHYGGGRFQLQFSIHTTDPDTRRKLIPVRLLSHEWIGRFGRRFRQAGDQRVTLNFAVVRGVPVDAAVVRRWFDPEDFLIKLTPVNPTIQAEIQGLESHIDPQRPDSARDLKESFEAQGFGVILSIGEVEENVIGSNCGMFASEVREGRHRIREGYQTRHCHRPRHELVR